MYDQKDMTVARIGEVLGVSRTTNLPIPQPPSHRCNPLRRKTKAKPEAPQT